MFVHKCDIAYEAHHLLNAYQTNANKTNTFETLNIGSSTHFLCQSVDENRRRRKQMEGGWMNMYETYSHTLFHAQCINIIMEHGCV